jgi:hypothetical protein
LHVDFLYVHQGCLKICLEKKGLNGQVVEKFHVVSKGEYVDFQWKETDFKDYVIKYILSCSANEKGNV